MKLKDIKDYIEQGINLSNDLVIEHEQDPSVKLHFDHNKLLSHNEIRKAFGLTMVPIDYLVSGLQAIASLPDLISPLPYYFIGEDERKYGITKQRSIFCIEDSTLRAKVGDFTPINIMRELETIIQQYRPKGKKFSEQLLGRAFRYNKLLVANGFSPEEFDWVQGKNNIFEMTMLASCSRSEIENKGKFYHRIFERFGETYIVNGCGELINEKTGKRATRELGYEFVRLCC